MSILIKGIDLPKEGEHIIALIKSNGKCSYWKQDTEYGICEPMRTVEAIQIPTPHGRLIDADALELEKEVELADDWKTAHEIANCVKYAPTILEEEK